MVIDDRLLVAAFRANHHVLAEPSKTELDQLRRAIEAYEAEKLRTPVKEGPDSWLIMKRGYFYRPNKQGYTTSKTEAGRYSEVEAMAEAAVGDGITIILADDWPRQKAGS